MSAISRLAVAVATQYYCTFLYCLLRTVQTQMSLGRRHIAEPSADTTREIHDMCGRGKYPSWILVTNTSEENNFIYSLRPTTATTKTATSKNIKKRTGAECSAKIQRFLQSEKNLTEHLHISSSTSFQFMAVTLQSH